MENKLAAVLFDLDGTLADTAIDLGAALNRVLLANNLSELSIDKIRPVASHGTRGLLKLGMGVGEEHPDFVKLRQDFLRYYEDCFTSGTVLFNEVNVLLRFIVEQGLLWGIITNKPKAFTNRLAAQLDFIYPPDVIVSGDTTSAAKPSTKPMYYACEQLKVAAQYCLYIGDASRDIEAGNNAGMQTVVANWGYLGAEDQVDTWGSDYIIDTPLQLIDIIKKLI